MFVGGTSQLLTALIGLMGERAQPGWCETSNWSGEYLRFWQQNAQMITIVHM